MRRSPSAARLLFPLISNSSSSETPCRYSALPSRRTVPAFPPCPPAIVTEASLYVICSDIRAPPAADTRLPLIVPFPDTAASCPSAVRMPPSIFPSRFSTPLTSIEETNFIVAAAMLSSTIAAPCSTVSTAPAPIRSAAAVPFVSTMPPCAGSGKPAGNDTLLRVTSVTVSPVSSSAYTSYCAVLAAMRIFAPEGRTSVTSSSSYRSSRMACTSPLSSL